MDNTEENKDSHNHNHDHGHDHGHNHDHSHSHSHDDEGKIKKHWPAITLAAVVAFICLFSTIAFTVPEGKHVIVTRFGEVKRKNLEPGLYFKLPAPIDKVEVLEKRTVYFERPLTQTALSDVKSIMISIYAGWQIDDPEVFLKSIKTEKDFNEKYLDNIIGTSTGNVLIKHDLDSIINTSKEKHKIKEIEKSLFDDVNANIKQYGVSLKALGIKQLGFTPKSQEKILERMKADRERDAQKYRTQGQVNSKRILADARLKESNIITEGKVEAERIKAEGEGEAATYFESFAKDAKLAKFLLDLESLRKVLKGKTTLVIDRSIPPLNMLNENALDKVKEK